MTEFTLAHLHQVLGFKPTQEQANAVTADLQPAVIVAGAGSGKTTSMAARVAWLVGRGEVQPENVLGLTFTTKATGQLLQSMREKLESMRVQGLLPVPPESEGDLHWGEPQVLTYHSFASRIVSEHGIRIGLEPGATLLEDGARQQLAFRLVCRTPLALGPFGKSPVTITSDLLALDAELAELRVSTDELRAFDDDMITWLRSFPKLQSIGDKILAASQQRSLLADLIDSWRAEKRSRGFIDFSDQIRLAGDILATYPEVVADLRERFHVILLDEYQDTSVSQRMLLQSAFGEGHPVLAVGDPCQAIYGWRGASVDNIDNFTTHFPVVSGDTRTPSGRYPLTENRRSGPLILEVANQASENLRSVHTGVDKLVAANNGKGPGILGCALFNDYFEERDWLVDEIARTGATGVPWKRIAVLAAKGADLLEVDSALRRLGIPTELVGAEALMAQPAVIEVRSVLELLHDPTANPAFVRVASGPRWRIGPRDLAALGRRASNIAGGRRRSEQGDLSIALDDAVAGSDVVETVSLIEALEDLGDLEHYSPQAVERFRSISAELRRLRAHVGEPLAELITRIARETGLSVELALGDPAVAAQQDHALSALVEFAAEFTEFDGRSTLGAFLVRLRDAERFNVDLSFDVAGPADAVQLLTVHKAKGLEFSHVFVPFVTKGGFPGGKGRSRWPTSASSVPWHLRQDRTSVLCSFPERDHAPKGVEHDSYIDILKELESLEEERLAYVAFTRAEVSLVVTGHWWGPTQKDPRGPHPYLSLVHELCKEQGIASHWAPPPVDGATNPSLDRERPAVAWPVLPAMEYQTVLGAIAHEMSSAKSVQPALFGGGDAVVAEWDRATDALLAEARARRAKERVVRLPDSVSASLMMKALSDPTTVAMDLTRPMPRPPAPAARRGTEFHAWVESRYGQQSLLDPDDLPGAADQDIATDEQLEKLKRAFEKSPYADRQPVAVEAAFAVVIGGRVVNGRIDAVFRDGDRFEVIDWKTGSAHGVDPVQLAIYQLAWSQVAQVPLDLIDAAFVMVATGEVLRPDTAQALALLRG